MMDFRQNKSTINHFALRMEISDLEFEFEKMLICGLQLVIDRLD